MIIFNGIVKGLGYVWVGFGFGGGANMTISGQNFVVICVTAKF